MLVIPEDLRFEGSPRTSNPQRRSNLVATYAARIDFYAVHFSFLFSSFSCLFSCIFSCSQVRARNYDSAQLSRADSLKAVARLCSLKFPDALVMWTDYYTYQLKKESWNTKQTNSWMSSREKAISFHDQSSFVLWTVFFSFLFFFFFFLTMAPQVLEKKIALLFTYRKIVIIFKSVELEHTLSSFPQSKGDQRTLQTQKKKEKKAALAIVGFIHVSSLTTGSPLLKQQEKVKSQQLKQVCISPDLLSSRTKCFSLRELKNRFLDLGLLLRGCRPKSRSLPGRVEVIQPVSTRVYNVLAYFYADYFWRGYTGICCRDSARLGRSGFRSGRSDRRSHFPDRAEPMGGSAQRWTGLQVWKYFLQRSTWRSPCIIT